MMTANEARAKAQALKEAEARENRARAERLCETYSLDINNAINLGKDSITVRGINSKLVDDVIAILTENGYTVDIICKNDIEVKW
jgi:Tfp pilus assembly protein PilX